MWYKIHQKQALESFETDQSHRITTSTLSYRIFFLMWKQKSLISLIYKRFRRSALNFSLFIKGKTNTTDTYLKTEALLLAVFFYHLPLSAKGESQGPLGLISWACNHISSNFRHSRVTGCSNCPDQKENWSLGIAVVFQHLYSQSFKVSHNTKSPFHLTSPTGHQEYCPWCS